MKVYCHTSYNKTPYEFIKGNWYECKIVNDNRYDIILDVDPFFYLITHLDMPAGYDYNKFSDYFYTKQEYRDKKLDKILTIYESILL